MEVEMLVDYLKILKIIDTTGKIRSRKKIQKMVYLMQQADVPFSEDFNLHLYGPYSSQLQNEINQLEDGKLIEQPLEDYSYILRLTEKGKEFLKEKEGLIKDLFTKENLELINELNGIDPSILEIMATIVYFEKSYGKNRGKLKEVLQEVKPKSKESFGNAWGRLDDLGLHFSG